MPLISPEDYQNLLVTCNGSPPIELLINATEDQQRRWWAVWERYQYLKESLSTFFKGGVDSSNPKNSFTPKDPVLAKFFKLDKNYWTKFYVLIEDYWLDIAQESPELAELGITTPGKALAIAIAQAAELHVSPAYTDYFRWTSSSRREINKKSKEVRRGVATPLTQKKVEAQLKGLSKHFDQHCQIQDFCIEACYSLAEGRLKRDNEFRQSLREYETAGEKRFFFLESQFLPIRKKAVGYEYRSGKYYPMSNKGGKPVT